MTQKNAVIKRTRKKYTRMHVVMPGPLLHDLKRLAARRMTTVSSLLRGLVLSEVERDQPRQREAV